MDPFNGSALARDLGGRGWDMSLTPLATVSITTALELRVTYCNHCPRTEFVASLPTNDLDQLMQACKAAIESITCRLRDMLPDGPLIFAEEDVATIVNMALTHIHATYLQ